MAIRIELLPEPASRVHLFRVLKVETSIDDIKLNIHEARHEFLYTILSPLIKRRIREAIEERVSLSIREYLVKFDQQLMSLLEATGGYATPSVETKVDFLIIIRVTDV